MRLSVPFLLESVLELLSEATECSFFIAVISEQPDSNDLLKH
jgi:hypothetical protein